MQRWYKDNKDNYEAWIGETAGMKVTLIPELGSKMISLRNVKTGREWLSRTELPLGNKGYASSFADSDGSGWDEIFPTISECRYISFPWKNTEMPDHGEVWSIPWNAVLREGKLQCDVYGVRLPYHLHKTYSFPEENRLRIDYSLRNLSPFSLAFLWAAHPLFEVEAGMEIIVPSEISEIVIAGSHKDRLGKFGDTRSWPLPFAEQTSCKLSIIEDASAEIAEKFYFKGELPEGKASLYDPRTDEQLTISFPKDKVPYMSIWANYGGYLNQYHVAIEPATGYLDDLSYAMENDAVAEVEGQGTYEWHVEISI